MKEGKPFIWKRIYTKAVAISPEDLEFLKKIKGKKSAAGKLHEIIESYKIKNIL